MRITAIILAAGKSKRMGQNKLGLLVNPHKDTILQQVIGNVEAANFDEIILVTSPDNEHLVDTSVSKRRIKVVINNHPEDGISSSIVKSLPHIDKGACGFAFIMADQPYMSAATMNALMEDFLENSDSIIIPQIDGKRGAPIIFPIDLLTAFEHLEGDTGGKQVISQYPDRVITHEIDTIVELEDIDTIKEFYNLTNKCLVLVRGGGDLASGIVYELVKNGYPVIITETPRPSCIRTEVSFASAIMEGGKKEIQGVTAQLVSSWAEADALAKQGLVPILLDPNLDRINIYRPGVLVDAIIAKRNLGTEKRMAPTVIGLGPGFTAPIDCHMAIETMRGPHLGEVIYSGSPLPNTGVPGLLAGEAENRVIHAPTSGTLTRIAQIGDLVRANDTIASIDGEPVHAKINGILRGLIFDGYPVHKGLKIADVDPRPDPSLAFTISDKAITLGRSVVRAIIKAD